MISLAGIPCLVLCSGPPVGENVPFIHYLWILDGMNSVLRDYLELDIFWKFFILKIVFLIFWGPFNTPRASWLFARVLVPECEVQRHRHHVNLLYLLFGVWEPLTVIEKTDHLLPFPKRLNKRCRLGKSEWSSFLLLDSAYLLGGWDNGKSIRSLFVYSIWKAQEQQIRLGIVHICAMMFMIQVRGQAKEIKSWNYILVAFEQQKMTFHCYCTLTYFSALE